jgi:hypothetical protein
MSADKNQSHAAGCASSAAQLDQFRVRVVGDAALQDTLLQPNDPETFITRVVEEGGRCGFYFTRDDVTAAMRAGQHAWRVRRIFG